MMRRIYVLASVAACLFSCGGGEELSPSDTFVKFFGENASLELKDMIFRSGGDGVIMFGTRSGEVIDGDFTYDEKNFYLVEADGNGNPVNQVMLEIPDGLGGMTHFDEEAGRITLTSDGGYLVIGKTSLPIVDPNDPNELIFLDYIIWTKLNQNFELSDTWHIVGDDLNNYVGTDIGEMSDGGVLISGYTDANGSNDFYYAKVTGLDTWTRIETRPGSDDQLIRSMPIVGGFALFGQTETLSGDGEGGINVERTIIDEQGVIQNSLIYGITDSDGYKDRDDRPSDVLERPGGYAIIGTSSFDATTYQPFIMLVDLQGAKEFRKVYDNEFGDGNAIDQNARGIGVVKMENNDYMIVGAIDQFELDGLPRGNESLVIRTNQAGEINNGIKAYGLINGEDEAIRALLSPDGSILIGATYDFGGGLKHFALLKVNTSGDLKK